MSVSLEKKHKAAGVNWGAKGSVPCRAKRKAFRPGSAHSRKKLPGESDPAGHNVCTILREDIAT